MKQILIHGRVSDADMEKGQLRCDCNVSVRAAAQRELGAKIEIKNMNSISGVRRALAYEVERQTAALEAGEILSQETRGWDDDATFVMRRKEMRMTTAIFLTRICSRSRPRSCSQKCAPACPNCRKRCGRGSQVSMASAPTMPTCSRAIWL